MRPCTAGLQGLGRAHPHVQGAYASWLGIMPVSSPKNIQFPCVEMNRQFLVYGDHAPRGVWVLTLQCPDGLHVRLSPPVCHGRVFSLDFTIVCGAYLQRAWCEHEKSPRYWRLFVLMGVMRPCTAVQW